jgi:hypothetical protein
MDRPEDGVDIRGINIAGKDHDACLSGAGGFPGGGRRCIAETIILFGDADHCFGSADGVGPSIESCRVIFKVAHVFHEVEIFRHGGGLPDRKTGLSPIVDSGCVDRCRAVGRKGAEIFPELFDQVSKIRIRGGAAHVFNVQGDAIEVQRVDDTGFYKRGTVRI